MSDSIASCTIFVTVAGSQAHGTARQGSDVDLRGVCIVPLARRVALFERFEQYEGALEPALAVRLRPRLETRADLRAALATKTECVVYDIGKLLLLCAAANPNALELLFTEPSDWLLDTPAWRRLHDVRRCFLTRKLQQTYLGYAMAQLAKIETHRGWLVHPPAGKPSRAEFGLPEHSTLCAEDRDRVERGIAERLRSYGVDDIEMPKATRIAVHERMRAMWSDVLGSEPRTIDDDMRELGTRSLGLPAALVSALEGERRYRGAMKQWESYQRWLGERNPVRAELERRHGYDTKHAMHLVRLMRMGVEVLRSAELHVRRLDADELIAIRDGALSFEQLLETAAELRAQLENCPPHPDLPADVDRTGVDALLLELLREYGD